MRRGRFGDNLNISNIVDNRGIKVGERI